MEDDAAAGTALTRPAQASSLARARADEVVFIDGRGQVRSPAVMKARGRLRLVRLGVLSLWLVGSLAWLFGTAGAVVGATLVAVWPWRALQRRRLARATRLSEAGHHTRAAAALRAVTRAPLVDNHTLGLAWFQLGSDARQRNQHADALEHLRRAQASVHERDPVADVSLLFEVVTLVDLDRVEEAAALLASRPAEATDGDYLRTTYWTAELYLAMALGRHQISADELHTRAREALRMTTSWFLLALLAWAHHLEGDLDQAWHLLRESLERNPLEAPTKSSSRLFHWIDAHRAEALADPG